MFANKSFKHFIIVWIFSPKSCQQTVSPCFAPTGQVKDFTINDAHNVLEAVTQSVAARAAGTGTTERTVRT